MRIDIQSQIYRQLPNHEIVFFCVLWLNYRSPLINNDREQLRNVILNVELLPKFQPHKI